MSLLSVFSTPPPDAALFVPSDRFFLRIVPLATDLPVAEQAELALEGLAPFPPAQLYWGCCVAPDRTQALVYAAHRRRFSAEESAAWTKAGLVVPGIVALCGEPPAKGPLVVVIEGQQALHGAAWPEGAAWPTAVQARALAEPVTPEAVQRFAAELAAKAGLNPHALEVLTSAVAPVARWEDDRLRFEQGLGKKTATGPVLLRADADLLDVREREFLQKRREEKRRGDLVWKLLLGGLAAAGLAVVLELGAFGLSLAGRMQGARVTAQAPLVQRLETANGVGSRIEELSRRQLRFFEMLAQVNEPRPRSILFTRTGSNGRSALDIEAQTPNADDVTVFEGALRALPAIQSAQVGEIRGRDGVTTFTMKVVFNPDRILVAAPAAGAAPTTPTAAPSAPPAVAPAPAPTLTTPNVDPTLPAGAPPPGTPPSNVGGAQ